MILVKKPEHKGKCKIHFAAVDDYLTREEKLKQTADAKSIYGLKFEDIVPDSHGDWMNQRDDSFSKFMRLDGKKTVEKSVFVNFSCGVKTNRDAWTYGSSSKTPVPSRMEQKCSVRLFLTTPECAVFLPM